MSLTIDALHKILKDQTRSKIILLLSEEDSLSYSNLMDTLGLSSTGTLNYHLKILGDLLSKNEAGQYVLSEKGKLAAKILTEFPNENDKLQKRKKQKRFWTVAALSQLVYLAVVLTLYFSNVIDFSRLILYSIMFVGSIGLAYLGYTMPDRTPTQGSEEERKKFKKFYPVAGGLAGLVAGFFGPVIATFVSLGLGGPNFLRIINEPVEVFALITSPIIIGAIVGYVVGKHNNFEKPKWMTKIDEKYGFGF
ncbi:MAG: winged helix-turn-helix domain-containing protein [Candidatus Bathyarchaeia archaeon]|jgi:MFS family permease